MLYRPHRLPCLGEYTHSQWLNLQHPQRLFHASRIYRADDAGIPNHYETLGLQSTATAAEVKKQFYSLSKTHHPDHNPDDPNASTRFVAISEAYATLGSTEKRSRYDRDFLRSTAGSPSAHPHHHQGSYSSHGTPAGGRPPSGLSRRRTQFRGPPPSFYRNGGWGTQGAKRAEHASKSSHAHEAAGNSASGNEQGDAAGHSSAYDAPGTGPSGFTHGFDNDVPHFDRDGHFRTQESVQRLHKMRRKTVTREDAESDYAGPSALFNFVIMSGVLATIFGVSSMFTGQRKGVGTGLKRKDD